MLIEQMNQSVPRYTSYPTAVQFHSIDENLYLEHLRLSAEPLSLYIHIPFCKTMCLFCACSVVLNRDPKKQSLYLQALLKEIEMIPPKTIVQLHLGGGTPTSLIDEEFLLLMQKLQTHFHFAPDAEISIEVDPRTVSLPRLHFLRSIGFNRVSFGVQDANPAVQEAVKRRQPWELSKQTLQWAKECGFQSTNLDLIYGLPLQTPTSFADTVQKIIAEKPDRIALFSYAKVPWLKPHQKAIPDTDLPSTQEKFQIYTEARASFIAAGYTAIGMDHFALKEDSLSLAYHQKKLYRNFQGYSVCRAENLIGLGVTAIGYVEGLYAQNTKDLAHYQDTIFSGHLPIFRGKLLTPDDHIRRYIIQKLMCDFSLDKRMFFSTFGQEFDDYSAKLQPYIQQGLVQDSPDQIIVTKQGELFIRNIASCFDAYFTEDAGIFSKGI